MAVKRRVIWMDDDHWFLLRTMAADRDKTVSALIVEMWEVAAAAHPAEPAEIKRSDDLLEQARAARYDQRPLRAVPKHR